MHRSRKRRKKHTRQVPSTTKGKNLDQTSKERRTKRNFRNRIEPEEDEEERANCAKPRTRTNNKQPVVCSGPSTTSNLNRRPPAKTTQQQSYRVPQELLFRNTNPSSNQKKQKTRRRTKGQQRLTPLDKITPTTNNKIKKH
jgi:hypothetical protein